MAAGDVTVQVVKNATPSKIDTAVTALRTGANDKYLMTSINNNHDIVLVHIEEV